MSAVLVHQSDLKDFARCPEQFRLSREGRPHKQLSATAYGSVMHLALHVLERTGDLDKAVATFEFYWHPANIEAVCERVDVWIRRDSYSTLLVRGKDALRKYAHLHRFREAGELVALEYEFVVPVPGTVDRETGRPHELGGTVDRLALTRLHREPVVEIQDFKTGQRPSYLRHDGQGTAYCFASQAPEFWLGNPAWHTDGFGERGPELLDRVAGAARRFTWIDLRACKIVDGGFRGPRDYQRLRAAVQAFADSVQAGIYPLAFSGEPCQWCSFRDVCAGVGLDDADGDPRPL